ncbi:MAG: hypothetical protein FWE05_13355, partial [Defluviitaleaceae bacterium]|nr:hypothetical protein [Defluviitaleaceae bacterium]
FLVLIDNLDNFIALCGFSKISTVEALFPKAMELGVCFVVTGTFRNLNNLTTMLKGSMGLILDSPKDHTSIFQIQAFGNYDTAPDIGYVCKRGVLGKIKLPLIKEV